MSKVITALYTNGAFPPLEPVVLPEGEAVQVHVPERPSTLQERLAALEAFDAMREELTEEQWRVFGEAAQRRPWFGGRQRDR
jgi:predicted DNA-binding antitoxin AbrB/MazE fold protein